MSELAAALEIRNAAVESDGIRLRGVSARVGAGELAVVVGRAGAGKTLLARLAGGFCAPASGEVLVAGRAPSGDPRHRGVSVGLAEDRIAFPRRRRVRTLLRECGRFFDHWDGEVALALLEGAGVPADGPTHPLPPFESWALAAALAMARRPAVLLLDEPPPGELRESALERMVETGRSAGAAVLLFLRAGGSWAPRADHLVFLREGRMVLGGSVDELRRRVRRIRFLNEAEDASALDLWFSLGTKIRGRHLELLVDDYDDDRLEQFASVEGISEVDVLEVEPAELEEELLRTATPPRDAELPNVRRLVS